MKERSRNETEPEFEGLTPAQAELLADILQGFAEQPDFPYFIRRV